MKFRPCWFCEKTGHHSSLCNQKFGAPQSSFQNENCSSNKQSGSSGSSKQTNPDDKTVTPKKTSTTVAIAQHTDVPEVDVAFLQTAVVNAETETGNRSTSGRCLMDSASSRTYVTESFCRSLGLQSIGSTYISVGRFGTTKRQTMETKRVRFVVVCNDGSHQPVLANVTPIITCRVSRHPIDPELYPIVTSLELAEPLNTVPDSLEIDILIGSDQYYNFVSTTGVVTCDTGLVFVPSRLGYLTAGTMPVENTEDGSPESTLVLLRPQTCGDPLHQGNFQIENVGAKETKVASVTDEEALQQFQPTDEKLLTEYNDIIQKQVDKDTIERAPYKPECLVSVDNVITGEETEPDTMAHYRESKQVFLGASMNLREFYTNSTTVPEAFAQNHAPRFAKTRLATLKTIPPLDHGRFRGYRRRERSRTTRRHPNVRSVVYRSRPPTRPKSRSLSHSRKSINGHRKPITSPLRSMPPTHSPRVKKRVARQESPSDSSCSSRLRKCPNLDNKISRKRGKTPDSDERKTKSSQKRGNNSRKRKGK